MKQRTTEETLVQQVQQWGQTEPQIFYILQMDMDIQNDSTLKFMVVVETVEDFIRKPDWVVEFGGYTKCHKASHGFFHVLKITYTCWCNH